MPPQAPATDSLSREVEKQDYDVQNDAGASTKLAKHSCCLFVSRFTRRIQISCCAPALLKFASQCCESEREMEAKQLVKGRVASNSTRQ